MKDLNRFRELILEVEDIPSQSLLLWKPRTSKSPPTKLQSAKSEYAKKCAWLDDYKSRGW